MQRSAAPDTRLLNPWTANPSRPSGLTTTTTTTSPPEGNEMLSPSESKQSRRNPPLMVGLPKSPRVLIRAESAESLPAPLHGWTRHPTQLRPGVNPTWPRAARVGRGICGVTPCRTSNKSNQPTNSVGWLVGGWVGHS